MSGEETKRLLVEATLRLLGREGFHAITTRRIAEEAGVNVAAVNYHFGSKDALVKQAALLFRDKMRELFSVLDAPGLTPNQKLRRLGHQFADNLVEYPGFLKTFVAALLNGQDPPAPARENVERGRDLMVSYLRQTLGGSDESIRNDMLQLMSAIVYPAVLGQHSATLYEVPFHDAEYRHRYVEQLMEHFGVGPAEDE
jgi:TetR/AcrR family transcriptional regulator, regulator of cefoperazone and chloramphenicol sensitivity